MNRTDEEHINIVGFFGKYCVRKDMATKESEEVNLLKLKYGDPIRVRQPSGFFEDCNYIGNYEDLLMYVLVNEFLKYEQSTYYRKIDFLKSTQYVETNVTIDTLRKYNDH